MSSRALVSYHGEGGGVSLTGSTNTMDNDVDMVWLMQGPLQVLNQ